MTLNTKLLDAPSWTTRLNERRAHLADQLYAMYSSLTGGITTDPSLMMIPADDHLPQRGDGVFESLKCLEGQLYNAPAHIDRLFRSCDGIGMDRPCSAETLLEILCQTIRAGGRRDCLIRVLVSRGTGNMGIDPDLCDGPVLYVVAYRYTSRSENGRPKPARAAISTIPMKPPMLAVIKTCNYLPNVLMKKEATRRGLDFVIALDENGNLGEGATENVAIVTPSRELLMPRPGYILTGTTARRAMELAHTLIPDGTLETVGCRDIQPDEAALAAEILIFGTTTDVTPVVEWEGVAVGNGRPGPVSERLMSLLRDDMSPESETLTEVFV